MINRILSIMVTKKEKLYCYYFWNVGLLYSNIYCDG